MVRNALLAAAAGRVFGLSLETCAAGLANLQIMEKDHLVENAEAMGARVVHQPERGYGNAYLKGFDSARGRYLVMGDADDTYDFTLIPEFLKALREGGNAFVTGSRYLGGGDGNITGLHRWFGNPFAYPASLAFAWRNGLTPADYDILGVNRFLADPLRPYGRIDIGIEDGWALADGWANRMRCARRVRISEVASTSAPVAT